MFLLPRPRPKFIVGIYFDCMKLHHSKYEFYKISQDGLTRPFTELLHRGKGHCFYHIILYYASSLASFLATLLKSEASWRRLVASPTIPGSFEWTLGLWLLFSILGHFGSSTLDKHRVLHCLSHPRLRFCPRYSGVLHLRLWYPSPIESTRRWLLLWYSGACSPTKLG